MEPPPVRTVIAGMKPTVLIVALFALIGVAYVVIAAPAETQITEIHHTR